MLLCLYDVIVESFNIVKKGTGNGQERRRRWHAVS